MSNFYEICSLCKKVFRGSHWRFGETRATGRIVCNICAPNREAAERMAQAEE